MQEVRVEFGWPGRTAKPGDDDCEWLTQEPRPEICGRDGAPILRYERCYPFASEL